jgi:hypothetical protein
MPSKSDIQFGKLAVANHFAAKDEVEAGLKEQAQFERERQTSILEAFLLHRKCISPDQVEAIQKKMQRRVVFCGKCRAKFNVFQFRGGEKFLCHKCGNRIAVPEALDYRKSLDALRDEAAAFLLGSKGAPASVMGDSKLAERETIVVSQKDIEKARSSKGAPKTSAKDSGDGDGVLEPVEEKKASGPPPATTPGSPAPEAVEVEVEAEIEAEPVEEPAPEAPAKPEAGEPAPAAEGPEKKIVRKIKIKNAPTADAGSDPPDKSAGPELKKKVKFEGKLKKKPK